MEVEFVCCVVGLVEVLVTDEEVAFVGGELVVVALVGEGAVKINFQSI